MQKTCGKISEDSIEDLLSRCVHHFVSLDHGACDFFLAKDNPMSSCLTIRAIHHFVSNDTTAESCHIHSHLDSNTVMLLMSLSLEIQFEVLEREREEESGHDREDSQTQESKKRVF